MTSHDIVMDKEDMLITYEKHIRKLEKVSFITIQIYIYLFIHVHVHVFIKFLPIINFTIFLHQWFSQRMVPPHPLTLKFMLFYNTNSRNIMYHSLMYSSALYILPNRNTVSLLHDAVHIYSGG